MTQSGWKVSRDPHPHTHSDTHLSTLLSDKLENKPKFERAFSAMFEVDVIYGLPAFSAPLRANACRRSGSTHANLCLVQHFVGKSDRVYVAGELYCPEEKQVQLVSSDMLISLYANWFPAIMDDRCRHSRFIVVAFLYKLTDIPAVYYETWFQEGVTFSSFLLQSLTLSRPSITETSSTSFFGKLLWSTTPWER